MDTMTAEWSEEKSINEIEGWLAGNYSPDDHDSMALTRLLRHHLHQSRADLMRKAVGVARKEMSDCHIVESSHCCGLAVSALLRLADDEGITVEGVGLQSP